MPIVNLFSLVDHLCSDFLHHGDCGTGFGLCGWLATVAALHRLHLGGSVNVSCTFSCRDEILILIFFVFRLGLTPESKVWVGAWWIGFLIFSFVCFLVAIPLIAYPKSLPGSEKLQKISEAHDGDNHKSQDYTKLREMPKAFMSLLRNPTFLFLNLAGASEGLIISGFAVFLPKQIENQYSVTAVWAALLMGLITVPAGGL